jgi:Na+-transporting NADH:ubiquinone oxidoreductase subunit D
MAGRINLWATLTAPLVSQNPVTLQILGLCSALAVTTSLATALTMSASLTVVLTLAAGAISMIRHFIPETIRLIIQIIVIASLVIVIDQVLQAFFVEMSRALSVFVSLITTNCLVLGRTEAFARHHRPIEAMTDALGNGLGYSLVLIVIGAIRELLGKGELFGFVVLPSVDSGGWYTPMSFMLLAPAGFFLLGALVWAVRSVVPEQAEEPEFSSPLPSEGAE